MAADFVDHSWNLSLGSYVTVFFHVYGNKL